MDTSTFLQMHPLDNLLQALIDHFNSGKDKIRFVALLSPMWPRWGKQGARAVHESIIKKFPAAEISISIVWIQMLPGDTKITAKEKAVIFNDPRVCQFWDPDQHSGKVVAEGLGYKGRVAWDIYLLYVPGGEWVQHPPEPAGWMHQISEDWADRKNFFSGEDLMKKLYDTTRGLLFPKA